MKFVKPNMNQTFTIDSKPEWPSIDFETDATGAHVWNWKIKWWTFTKSGTVNTINNKWNAKSVIANYGGTLTVQVMANNTTASITVVIKGTSPRAFEVTTYLATKANSAGFEKIIEHESKFKHFNVSNEPIKSFDNGYGMCQLTTPAPGFDQVWN